MAFSIVKHFIEEDTRQKIVVMGGELMMSYCIITTPDDIT
jgi:hypothetical protein